MFGFRMVNHSKTDLQNVRNSNVFGIRMFGIRAPTVLESPHFVASGIQIVTLFVLGFKSNSQPGNTLIKTGLQPVSKTGTIVFSFTGLKRELTRQFFNKWLGRRKRPTEVAALHAAGHNKLKRQKTLRHQRDILYFEDLNTDHLNTRNI